MHKRLAHQHRRHQETLSYQLLMRHPKRQLHLCLVWWPPVLFSTQTLLSHNLLQWLTKLFQTWTSLNHNCVQLLYTFNRRGQDTPRNPTATMCDVSVFVVLV
ncbi:hypothetical protein HPB50_001941 [Hyalomma asiaticum]|uniref:Uncharacterized protein n=1 Tax=Hyalomma asiaticum TaxID=266040 RepID=A0ACB7TB09_HYAAI|nr:hypothetical protein HPB50_001941 [Hyalomma asiaticum]